MHSIKGVITICPLWHNKIWKTLLIKISFPEMYSNISEAVKIALMCIINVLWMCNMHSARRQCCDWWVWWFIFKNFKAFSVQRVLKWNYSAVKASESNNSRLPSLKYRWSYTICGCGRLEKQRRAEHWQTKAAKSATTQLCDEEARPWQHPATAVQHNACMFIHERKVGAQVSTQNTAKSQQLVNTVTV